MKEKNNIKLLDKRRKGHMGTSLLKRAKNKKLALDG